jgi:nitroreductase
VDLEATIRARRMVRAFEDRPIEQDRITRLLDLARRAPSAGHTAATEFVVLTGDERRRYWDTTLPDDKRANFTYPSLPMAAALVLVLTRPDAYPERYSEPDKASTGLGAGTDSWPVPFWWVDAGAVVQNLLLLAHSDGLAALLFGTFDHEPTLRSELGIPVDRRIVGVVALGHAAAESGPPGRSVKRKRPGIEAIIHRQRWTPSGAERH